MPTGPGYGNGTGGANGARGVVASTGFGSGVATGNSSSSQRTSVRQAGFGDADVAGSSHGAIASCGPGSCEDGSGGDHLEAGS